MGNWWGLDPYQRPRGAAKGVRGDRNRRGGGRGPLRLPPRRAALRRAPARGHRIRARPDRCPPARHRLDPGRDRVPEDGLRRGPADRRPGPGRRAPTARSGNLRKRRGREGLGRWKDVLHPTATTCSSGRMRPRGNPAHRGNRPPGTGERDRIGTGERDRLGTGERDRVGTGERDRLGTGERERVGRPRSADTAERGRVRGDTGEFERSGRRPPPGRRARRRDLPARVRRRQDFIVGGVAVVLIVLLIVLISSSGGGGSSQPVPLKRLVGQTIVAKLAAKGPDQALLKRVRKGQG